MIKSGVFWYGLVILAMVTAGWAQQPADLRGNGLDLVLALAVTWLFLILPVMLIRNHRAKRKARHAVP